MNTNITTPTILGPTSYAPIDYRDDAPAMTAIEKRERDDDRLSLATGIPNIATQIFNHLGTISWDTLISHLWRFIDFTMASDGDMPCVLHFVGHQVTMDRDVHPSNDEWGTLILTEMNERSVGTLVLGNQTYDLMGQPNIVAVNKLTREMWKPYAVPEHYFSHPAFKFLHKHLPEVSYGTFSQCLQLALRYYHEYYPGYDSYHNHPAIIKCYADHAVVHIRGKAIQPREVEWVDDMDLSLPVAISTTMDTPKGKLLLYEIEAKKREYISITVGDHHLKVWAMDRDL